MANTGQVRTELDEHLGGDTLTLADETEEDVFGADVVVTQLQRLTQRQFEHLFGARGEGDVATGGRTALADDLLDLAADRLKGDTDTLTLVDQAKQNVLGPDVVVVEQAGFFLSQDDDPTGPVCESLEHVAPCPPVAGPPPTETPKWVVGGVYRPPVTSHGARRTRKSGSVNTP